MRQKYFFLIFILLTSSILLNLSLFYRLRRPITSQPISPLVYFSSNSKISDQIIKSINNSQKTIDLALYEFTSEELQKVLDSARDRGVKTRIIADRLQASDKDTVIPKLIKDGYDIKLLSGRQNKKNQGSMHHKFAIFDGRLLEVGSYNWTYSADNLNYENALFITDKNTINQYQSEFDRLWEEVRP